MSAIPIDQAGALRLLMAEREYDDKCPRAATRTKTARVIAIASGKGGVGKTSVAVNLALQLSGMGKRVVLIDADLGTANADLLLNVNPSHRLGDLFEGGCTADDILTPAGARLQLIAGASGLATIADLSAFERRKLLDELACLEDRCDVILIDCGAGISQNVMAFARSAHDLLIVTTPEPTAITDAYALIKVLARSDPVPAMHIVMNQVQSREDGRVAGERLAHVASQFLRLEVAVIGQIPCDENVGRAVRRRQPFIRQYPHSPASTCIAALADSLSRSRSPEPVASGFFDRLVRFFH